MNSSTVNEKKYTNDASPSWNGYNHQGKIGLLVMIKMMNDLKLTFEECKAYELELEWMEDFSIKKHGKYDSLHQVKTYNKTAPSEYKDPIWVLLAKIADFEDIQKAYLHSTTKISKEDDLKDLLYNYTPPTTPKVKDDNSKSKQDIKYWTPLQCHDYVKNNHFYDKAFSKFDIYKYEEGFNFCSMDDAEIKIKRELLKLYNEPKTEQQLKKVYLHLTGLIDDHIRKRHKDVQISNNEKKATINFQEVCRVINKNYEVPSKEYMVYELKHRFSKLTNEYYSDLLWELDEGQITVNELSNIKNVVDAALKLDEVEFMKFCLRISPNHKFKENEENGTLNALSTLLLEQPMTEGFFEILKKIQREINHEKFTFVRLNPDNLNISYLPTTITESFHGSRTLRLVERILDNTSDGSLHEVDVMITSKINLSSLKDGKINKGIPDPDEKIEIDEQSEEYHNRISKIKKIRLINLDVAKGEIDK